MARLTVKYTTRYRDEFGRFVRNADAAEEAAVAETLAEFVSTAQGFAPKRTGELEGSIEAHQAGKTGTVTAGTDHAAPQEYGAVPHAIPNAFGFGPEFGDWPDFHPGNPATHFMRRAADVMKDKFVRNVERRFPSG